MHSVLIATLAAAALGWSDISVTASRSGAANAPWQRSLANLNRPTERTQETLQRYNLTKEHRSNPTNALLRLEKTARRSPEPELVFALAELSWLEGQRLEKRRKPEALDHYLDAVAYAFDFLFDPELAAGRQPSDPRFLMALDLYNGGLDRIIRAMKAKGPILPGGDEIVLEFRGREIRLKVNLEQSPWAAADIDELLVCSDFQVSGLPSRTYQYGLGVPLIGVRRPATAAKPDARGPRPESVEGQVGNRYFPPEMAFPLTAVLRPNSRLRDPNANVGQVRASTLDLLDPVTIRSWQVDAQYSLAIESDLTTPLAYMWSRTDYGRYRWTGFLRPASALERTGLMLVRPYETGKIPVVLVHGLMSSPLSWIPMVNELLRDPEIQSRYQFFLYVYPTGVPLPIAASMLRSALVQAQGDFDPSFTDPSFNRMVLLGHSMGGLLSHAMAVDSGDHFWHLNSYWRFDDLIGPREVLEEVRQYTFFKPLPFIERVVFLATPHRGSEFANGLIGRIGSGLISDTDHYSNLLAQLVKDNPDAFNSRKFRRLPTSIENLEVDAPALLALLAMTPGPGIKYHSIIGAKAPGPPAGSTDGVVTYRSSHLDNVVSELVVGSEHSVQKAPAAILEVRRILREHLMQQPAAVTTSANVPVPPVGVATRPTQTVTPAVSPGVARPPAVPVPAQAVPGGHLPPRPPTASPLDNLPPLLPPGSAPGF